MRVKGARLSAPDNKTPTVRDAGPVVRLQFLVYTCTGFDEFEGV